MKKLLGLEFARYLEQRPPDTAMDSEAFRSFQKGLREGDPPEGQRLLGLAFERYQQQSARSVERTKTFFSQTFKSGFTNKRVYNARFLKLWLGSATLRFCSSWAVLSRPAG